jgi:hypothetical protein
MSQRRMKKQVIAYKHVAHTQRTIELHLTTAAFVVRTLLYYRPCTAQHQARRFDGKWGLFGDCKLGNCVAYLAHLQNACTNSLSAVFFCWNRRRSTFGQNFTFFADQSTPKIRGFWGAPQSLLELRGVSHVQFVQLDEWRFLSHFWWP